MKLFVLPLLLAGFVTAAPALADAKWVRVGEPKQTAAPPAQQLLELFFGGTLPDGGRLGLSAQRDIETQMPWVYRPSKRKIVYGLPVVSSSPGLRRGGYLVGPNWTPYTGTAVRTPNGLAISRPDRSVSGSMKASRIGSKISRRLN